MEKENILGTEKIGKLMRKFSIPCIISLVVNSLYNIVDQIFIGWGVGYLGNGATNVVFPLTMICLAFALMFGDGSSAFLSLKLGEKKKDEAKKGVANGILSSIIISILFCIIVLVFLPQLKEAVSLLPGMVITIPANVKHWHGAKKDCWFSHLAIEVPGENTNNEWCESVNDEEYDKLC